MPRDYKHVRRGSNSFSGWAGLVIGLVLGLGVAAAVYVNDRRAGGVAAQAPLTSDDVAPDEKPAPASQAAEPETQLEFYDMLEKFEVVVPERDRDGRQPAAGAAPVIDRPGAYILQAGSFRNAADADRMRAMLALQGLESKVEKVPVDSDTWHRVRIGPMTDLKAVEDARRKLREVQIDALVIRVGE